MSLPKKNIHSKNLDVLRWIVAFIVVFHHLSNYASSFDKTFSFGNAFAFNYPGHISVLVFFILSGYVIQLNTLSLSNRGEISSYIKKRLVRIFPIYFIVVTLSFFLSHMGDIKMYLSNVFFVSVIFKNLLIYDAAIWSLNYEILYYALFIPIMFFRIDVTRLTWAGVAISVLLSAASIYIKIPPLIVGYFVGFSFWIAGAAIAKLSHENAARYSDSKILSAFLFIFCLLYFNPIPPLLNALHIAEINGLYPEFQQYVRISDLFYFPALCVLICLLTRVQVKYYKLVFYGTVFVSTARMASILWKNGGHFFVNEHFIPPTIILAACIALYFMDFQLGTRIKKRILSLNYLSHISYAVYIVHLPLIFVFSAIHVDTPILFTLKIILYFATVILISYLLEMKFQPFIKKLLYAGKK